jgi:hypothetical protein
MRGQCLAVRRAANTTTAPIATKSSAISSSWASSDPVVGNAPLALTALPIVVTGVAVVGVVGAEVVGVVAVVEGATVVEVDVEVDVGGGVVVVEVVVVVVVVVLVVGMLVVVVVGGLVVVVVQVGPGAVVVVVQFGVVWALAVALMASTTPIVTASRKRTFFICGSRCGARSSDVQGHWSLRPIMHGLPLSAPAGERTAPTRWRTSSSQRGRRTSGGPRRRVAIVVGRYLPRRVVALACCVRPEPDDRPVVVVARSPQTFDAMVAVLEHQLMQLLVVGHYQRRRFPAVVEAVSHRFDRVDVVSIETLEGRLVGRTDEAVQPVEGQTDRAVP